MQLNARVSTTFAAQHDTHQVKLLVTIGAESPLTRPPINAALVIDRSGSMAGAPLEHACAAAAHFASFLSSGDRLTLVVFDDTVQTVLDGVPGNDPRIAPALGAIASGGQTNLSGGWLEGHRHLSRHRVTGTNRILLLTDGQANCGLTAAPDLERLTSAAAARGVTTTCIGFGPRFNEDLLRAMSDMGGGRFWYVEQVDQMGDAFSGEIEGL
ncbi:MAG TPA: VWA domain-containing protein, partial [Gemmatimonadales bacterium]|nr:VWA domain-containing protein [Gemmatimonadales bacterium]